MLPSIQKIVYDDLCQPTQGKLVTNNPTHRTTATKRGNRILVIEDDRILCLGMDIRLKASDYDLSFAHNAESGLASALSQMPDLVILDIGLPGHDGYFVMRSFKEFPELADLPIVVLSAGDWRVHEARCQEAGARRFLQKPIDHTSLMETIRQLITN